MTSQTIDDARIFATLKSTFGYTSFRSLQHEIVQAILGGYDVSVLMPTGGGKSLCYQLPALLLPGTTVVVSPLIALMKDQVDALDALGVAATFINSSLDVGEIRRRQAMLARGAVTLVYVAPERLLMPEFLRLLQSTPLSFFAIDEAHCISEWGHDFRPEYRELTRLRHMFPGIPIGAFTATATERVRADIQAQLSMDSAIAFQGSFNRPNLFYEVRPKKGAYANLLAYLRTRRDASGIIYCGSRAATDELAKRLRGDGFRAAAYHAGLESHERRQRHEAFMRDDIRIMTATTAFGMGIDKPDVRFVVHYDLPKTLENYYQESGRAGRDGDPSDAVLYYSAGDVVKLRHFVNEKANESERRGTLSQIQRMADWAESAACRRRKLLAYFGEPFDTQEAPCCDICRDPSAEEDATIPAQMLLSCIKRTGERFGAAYVIDVLRGSRSQRLLDLGHDSLSTYGIGRDRSVDEWRSLARQLIQDDYILQDEDQFNVLKVTQRGHAVLFENERVTVSVRRTAPRSDAVATDEQNPQLFDVLRALRKRLADERGIPPYVIFHDKTLRQIGATAPRSIDDLLRIPGVGQRKAQDFGPIFLPVIAEYLGQAGGAESSYVSAPRPRAVRIPGELGESARESLRLYREGHAVASIARARNLAETTIENHLTEAIEAGEHVDVSQIVQPDKQQAIVRAFDMLGTERLKPVMEHLGNDYTYGELRIMRSMTLAAGAANPEVGPVPATNE
ncbi:MAG: DNA helicase RecQ [Chloroflexota bacterium]